MKIYLDEIFFSFIDKWINDELSCAVCCLLFVVENGGRSNHGYIFKFSICLHFFIIIIIIGIVSETSLSVVIFPGKISEWIYLFVFLSRCWWWNNCLIYQQQQQNIQKKKQCLKKNLHIHLFFRENFPFFLFCFCFRLKQTLDFNLQNKIQTFRKTFWIFLAIFGWKWKTFFSFWDFRLLKT